MLPDFAYNEYKYQVSNEMLGYVRQAMDDLYGGSDPFPEGVVDSVYFDTPDRQFYDQCLDGESTKIKFRIRGYGDGSFRQLHLKKKDVFGVGKLKSPIDPVLWTEGSLPDWNALRPLQKGGQFDEIIGYARNFGYLSPVVRVRYYRYRYRIADYRLTLNTRIEVTGFPGVRPAPLNYGLLPYHVLEIKSREERPHLPMLGLVQLPQVSFSKFFLGLNLLDETFLT